MRNSLKQTKLSQPKAAFFNGGDILYPSDYVCETSPSVEAPSTQPSNVVSLRPFLKEGNYNHLISYFLQNRPYDGSPIVLSVFAINKIVSPQIGLNRTTIIRQLQAIASESELPSKEQNPYINVQERGEKKKGITNQRYFIISFKQKIPKNHVVRHLHSDASDWDATLHTNTEAQVMAAYEHEAQRIEDGYEVRRMNGGALACRLGVKLNTIRRAQKSLFEAGHLKKEIVREKFNYTVYNHENGKRTTIREIVIKERNRVVYKPTKICSQNVIVQNDTPSLDNITPVKILDFNEGSLKHAQAHEAEKKSSKTPSQDFSKFREAWDTYCQIFTPKDGESLNQSLGAAKKYGVHLPAPERMMEALERSKEILYLKLAHRVGFQEAEKAQLLAKGGTLNDSSVHWKKDIQGKHARLRFLWILKHTEDILAGKYDRKELSEQAKGRVWGGHDHHPTPNTSVKRTEVPAQWFNEYLIGLSTQKDLRALLARFWNFFGWEFYESWLDPCRFVKTEDGEWKMVAPNRFHAEMLEKKLETGRKRVAYDEGTTPAQSKMREAFEIWLKERPQLQEPQEERAEYDTTAITENSTTSREESEVDEMGIVPANDDEGVIPAYVDDDAPHESGQMPPHMGGREKSQNLANDGRESEKALLRLKKARKERMLRDVRACTNMHRSERALRAHTIEQYGISAYQCWFDKCKIEILGEVAIYISPSDFIGYEIERRYKVILEHYTAKGLEITFKKKKEKL